VIKTESDYQPQARSPRGAQGLMQLMPATARQLGVSNPRDPAQNILAGARYLQQLRQQFNDNLPLALAAYNAGPAAVLRHGNTIPPYAETQAYVPRVMQEYQRLLSQY
ncbi:MAG: lytic transglycosylase domain-containing protein, partial [Methylobacillus glycogenes]|nr:lytic transglycosylase domain-containing protein [Methylobacillus glycogenes]